MRLSFSYITKWPPDNALGIFSWPITYLAESSLDDKTFARLRVKYKISLSQEFCCLKLMCARDKIPAQGKMSYLGWAAFKVSYKNLCKTSGALAINLLLHYFTSALLACYLKLSNHTPVLILARKVFHLSARSIVLPFYEIIEQVSTNQQLSAARLPMGR